MDGDWGIGGAGVLPEGQAGPHAPKVGCWECLEAFLEEAEHVMSEDGGHCPHPEGPRVMAAFRAWAADLRIEHFNQRDPA